MNAFLKAFAKETGLDDIEADEQWAAYSRQLTDRARAQLERDGTRSGIAMGRQFRRDYPKAEDETTP